MSKYQVVYQGYEPEPNQILTEPIDFETANQLVCELQAEVIQQAPEDYNPPTDFYVVEPILSYGINYE